MWIIIIVGIVVLGTGLWKHLLFNPQINSAFSIYCVYRLIREGELTTIMFLLYVVVIIDCIRDIIIAKTYYDCRDIEYRVDPLYRTKSLLSLFTLGLARVVFLVFADRFIAASVSSDIDKVLQEYKIIPHYGFHISNYASSFSQKHFLWQYNMKYDEVIREKLKKGTILSNKEIVNSEFGIYEKKLARAYPQNLVEKIGEIISAEGKRAKIEREYAREEIFKRSWYYAYVDKTFYNDCKEIISSCLANYGALSPDYIAQVLELENIEVFQKNIFSFPPNWVKYMVIFMIQPLVKDGVVEECNISDGILENHQYKHIEGIPMLSRNAEDDPRLALDD